MKPEKIIQEDGLDEEGALELRRLGVEPPPRERAEEISALVRKAIQSGLHGCARGRPQNDNE